MDVLEELCVRRRADAAEAERNEPAEALMRRIADIPPPADFRAAFAGDGLNAIAEIKRASPSAGLIRADFDPAALAREYEAGGAAAISVLCEPHRFLGGDADLRTVRRVTALPLLYKDFVTTPYQVLRARACGADAVLLIAAALDDAALRGLLARARSLRMAALVETHDEAEIGRALDAGARIVGVNCRDLRTFRTDPALAERLIGRIPSGVVRIAESGLRTHGDLLRLRAAGADGFLVGTELMRSPSPGVRLSELLGSRI